MGWPHFGSKLISGAEMISCGGEGFLRMVLPRASGAGFSSDVVCSRPCDYPNHEARPGYDFSVRIAYVVFVCSSSSGCVWNYSVFDIDFTHYAYVGAPFSLNCSDMNWFYSYYSFRLLL